MIKIRAEIDETENRKIGETMNGTKSSFFRKSI